MWSKWVLGIDVSTSHIGFCLLRKWKYGGDEPKVEYTKDLELPKYSIDWVDKEIVLSNMKDVVEEIFHKIWIHTDVNETTYVNIIVELANFSNPKITQRFAEYTGMLVALIYSWPKYPAGKYFSRIVKLKYAAANDWFKEFAKEFGFTNWAQWPRTRRKEVSIKHFPKDVKVEKLTDNITDAYWLAKYFDNIGVDNEPKPIKNNKRRNSK